MVKIGAEYWKTRNLTFSSNAPGVPEVLREATAGEKALRREETGMFQQGLHVAD